MDWHAIDARVAILPFYDRETNLTSFIAKQSADFTIFVFLGSSYHA